MVHFYFPSKEHTDGIYTQAWVWGRKKKKNVTRKEGLCVYKYYVMPYTHSLDYISLLLHSYTTLIKINVLFEVVFQMRVPTQGIHPYQKATL